MNGSFGATTSGRTQPKARCCRTLWGTSPTEWPVRKPTSSLVLWCSVSAPPPINATTSPLRSHLQDRPRSRLSNGRMRRCRSAGASILTCRAGLAIRNLEFLRGEVPTPLLAESHSSVGKSHHFLVPQILVRWGTPPVFVMPHGCLYLDGNYLNEICS